MCRLQMTITELFEVDRVLAEGDARLLRRGADGELACQGLRLR